MKRKRRAKILRIGQNDYLAAMRKAARELDLAVGRKVKHKGSPEE